MPLLETRPFQESLLEVPNSKEDVSHWNHIFEPEYHQSPYVDACLHASMSKDAFQLGDTNNLECEPHRGIQPQYADTEDEPEALEYEGMILGDGSILDSANGMRDVCALKSVSVRWGFVDFSSARSVSRDFYTIKKGKAGVAENDVLINSTGDGTIGRVAITIVSFRLSLTDTLPFCDSRTTVLLGMLLPICCQMKGKSNCIDI